MAQTVGVADGLEVARRPDGRTQVQGSRIAQVTVLVHTRNQAHQIADFATRVEALPDAIAGEMVFVDDSDDATPEAVRRVAEQVVIPVHLVHRTRGDRSGGLGTAVRAGLRVARCQYVCVVDGAEHAPEDIPALVQAAASARADLVLGGSTHRFFLLRRGAIDLDMLRGKGARMVRELVRRTPGLRVTEVPVRQASGVGPAPVPARLRSPWRTAAPRPVG